ncbi:Uncharacterized protein Fot_18741 [Forsythia ovata]|uniref:Uncharacterized protein n=1 Tax=Forsythia ovata TaxID=205694 RepID=A0ABD1VLV1_9LAMI
MAKRKARGKTMLDRVNNASTSHGDTEITPPTPDALVDSNGNTSPSNTAVTKPLQMLFATVWIPYCDAFGLGKFGVVDAPCCDKNSCSWTFEPAVADLGCE